MYLFLKAYSINSFDGHDDKSFDILFNQSNKFHESI